MTLGLYDTVAADIGDTVEADILTSTDTTNDISGYCVLVSSLSDTKMH